MSRPALAALLGGTALFLAVENAVLLFAFGPAIHWPAQLEGLGVALRVARVLGGALAPWLLLGVAAVFAGAAAMWAAMRFQREVNHA
jgi:hypothetical protein